MGNKLVTVVLTDSTRPNTYSRKDPVVTNGLKMDHLSHVEIGLTDS